MCVSGILGVSLLVPFLFSRPAAGVMAGYDLWGFALL